MKQEAMQRSCILHATTFKTMLIEVNSLQNAVFAQTIHATKWMACDPVFSPTFYKPYELAVETAFLMLCATRDRMDETGSGSQVRAMTFRLKAPGSIRDKLARRGQPLTQSAAHASLHDIAGLRVVLSSIDQVYRFASRVRETDVAEYVGMRDYISTPKKSGYRSLHLLMRVPVQLGSQVYMIPVEIQLRTSAMDIWASIEHDACYKPVRSALQA